MVSKSIAEGSDFLETIASGSTSGYLVIMLELLQKSTPAKVPDLAEFLTRLPSPRSGD